MTWTPMISSTFFDGVQSDMLVAAGGISTNVSTLMIAFIGIGLLFLGYAYVRRTMSAGKRI